MKQPFLNLLNIFHRSHWFWTAWKKEGMQNISYYKKRMYAGWTDRLQYLLVSEIYKEAIEQQYKTTKLHAPLNRSIPPIRFHRLSEHTWRMKSVRKWRYDSFKAEYEEKKNKLTELYDLQKQTRESPTICKKPFQWNLSAGLPPQKDIGEICIWWNKRAGRASQTEPNALTYREEVLGTEQTEYFNMELLSLIHVTCIGEQFENISEHNFYTCMNLLPNDTKPQIRPRKKYVPAIWYSWWAKNCPNRRGELEEEYPENIGYWGKLLQVKVQRACFRFPQWQQTGNLPKKWMVYSW